MARGVILLGGLACAAVFGAISLALTAFMIFQLTGVHRPDPTVVDGDPCCAYPDTWEDVAGAVFGAAVSGGLGIFFFMLAGVAAAASVTTHIPAVGWRAFLIAGGAWAALTTGLLFAAG